MTMVGFSIANVSFPGFSQPLIMPKNCVTGGHPKVKKPFANSVEFPGTFGGWPWGRWNILRPFRPMEVGVRFDATRGEVEASRAAEKGGEPGDTRDGYPHKNQPTNQPTTSTTTTTTTTNRRTRWWFQTFFSFVTPGEMIQFDDHLHIFQMGW